MAIPATERSPKGYSTDRVVSHADAEAIRTSLYRADGSANGCILERLPDHLSAQDAEFFATNGYLAANGLLTLDEVHTAREALSDLIRRRAEWDSRVWCQEEPYYAQGGQDERAADDPELRIRKLAYFVHIEPKLAVLASHPRLIGAVDRLLGPGSRLIQDMALLKPAFRGSEKPWHQDTAYFDWTPLSGILGVWIALDEATVENGCMQIVPGSHLAGPVAHYHVRDCQIADHAVSVERIATIPLQPGGVLFFSGLLQHGTPPNHTAQRRRAVQFHYAAAHCTRMTIEQHGELFNADGLYAGCRDWDLEEGISRAVLTP